MRTRTSPKRRFCIFALVTTVTTHSPMTDFIHTWTKLSTHEQCPRMFEDRYLGPKKPFVETEQSKWGNEVHKAMEDRIKLRELTPLPASMQRFQKYLDAALVAQERGLEVIPEWNIGITREGKPCDYWDKDVWLRDKIDLAILGERTALLQDYKTGKWKSETGQLALNSWPVFALRSDVDVINTRYLWMQGGDQLKRVYTRGEEGGDAVSLDKIKKTFMMRLQRVENDLASGVFKPTPNGLCKKHCNVLDCEYNGRGR